MNNNLICIAFVIDKSGSMMPLIDSTVEGFNSFLARYRESAEDAILTTTLFDDKYRFLHDGVDLASVCPMSKDAYVEGGMGCTALYDAVGATIDHVGKRLAAMDESERPGKVLFVVTTDGYENASHTYTKEQVKAMIQHQTEKYSWEFIFLGANINAEETASSIGISADRAFNHTHDSFGVSNAYAVAGEIATCYSKGVCLDSVTALYKDENGFINVVSDNITSDICIRAL